MSSLTAEILAGYVQVVGRKQELLDCIEGLLEEQRSQRRAVQRAAKAAVA